MLPKILPRVQSRYPQLKLRLHETLTSSLLAELAEGSLDAVILALPVTGEHVAAMPMFDDEFLLARRSRRNRAGPEFVSRESLAAERMLLLNDGHCLRDQALSYCGSLARERLEEFGATSLSTILQMVANGYGVTLLPELAVDCELTDERIEVRRFASPVPKRTVGIAWQESSTRAKDYIALGHLIADAYKSRERAM
jgi:LysR family hydrogen peroxide-inducible transcriptional activator